MRRSLLHQVRAARHRFRPRTAAAAVVRRRSRLRVVRRLPRLRFPQAVRRRSPQPAVAWLRLRRKVVAAVVIRALHA